MRLLQKTAVVAALSTAILQAACQKAASREDGSLAVAGTASGGDLCGPETLADAFTFNLDRCAGSLSFLEAMMRPGGIKELIDKDGETLIQIPSPQAVATAGEVFAPEVTARLLRLFKNGQSGVDDMVGKLQGKRVTPLSIRSAIRNVLRDNEMTKPTPLAATIIQPYLAIASNGGSTVRLDGRNRFVNVAYAPGYRGCASTGRDIERDVRTGRSFGVTEGLRGALDVSDIYYLDELKRYLLTATPAQRQDFHRALLQLLTGADPSGIKTLSADGQQALTDFIAVYAAELDRHLMTGLRQYPWENDLIEATWISTYVVASGKMVIKGQFTSGEPRNFFAQGPTGGGIGKTRQDRRKLQQLVSTYVWQRYPQEAERLGRLIEVKKGDDLFGGLARFTTTQAKARAVAIDRTGITDAMLEILRLIDQDARQVAPDVAPSR